MSRPAEALGRGLSADDIENESGQTEGRLVLVERAVQAEDLGLAGEKVPRKPREQNDWRLGSGSSQLSDKALPVPGRRHAVVEEHHIGRSNANGGRAVLRPARPPHHLAACPLQLEGQELSKGLRVIAYEHGDRGRFWRGGPIWHLGGSWARPGEKRSRRPGCRW